MTDLMNTIHTTSLRRSSVYYKYNSKEIVPFSAAKLYFFFFVFVVLNLCLFRFMISD